MALSTNFLDDLGASQGIDASSLDFSGLTQSWDGLAGSGQDFGIPGIGQAGGGLGFNADTLKLGLQGIGTLGNLWAAFNAQKLAKKQFNLTKKVTEANLANSISSYNTTLEDRARARAITEGQTDQQRDDYVNKNRLPTT